MELCRWWSLLWYLHAGHGTWLITSLLMDIFIINHTNLGWLNWPPSRCLSRSCGFLETFLRRMSEGLKHLRVIRPVVLHFFSFTFSILAALISGLLLIHCSLKSPLAVKRHNYRDDSHLYTLLDKCDSCKSILINNSWKNMHYGRSGF